MRHDPTASALGRSHVREAAVIGRPRRRRALTVYTRPQATHASSFRVRCYELIYGEVTMPDVDQVEVVLANNDRVTLCVGDVFLKIDADQRRTDVEVEAMAMAPVPTPEVLWRKP